MDWEQAKEAGAGIDLRPEVLAVDPETTLHVDGDYAAYYFSGNDDTSLADAKRNLIGAVEVAARLGGAGKVVIHLTHGLSGKAKRFLIATVKPYQGQRDSGRKPKNWEAMREWLERGKTLAGTTWRVVIWEDREADDGVAAAARYEWSQGRVPVIFSRDKDFRMIPGRHITWVALDRVETTPQTFRKEGPDGEIYGTLWFWMQMLQGDTADNIPGLEKQPAKEPGKFKTCGEGCARDHLLNTKDDREAYEVVTGLYKAYYGGSWADRFVEQAALLWLRNDNKAAVGNFTVVLPRKDPEVWAALSRMERRIRQ